MIKSLLLLLILSPPFNKPVEVDGVLFNTVYNNNTVSFRQIVFMNKNGVSLGFYNMTEENYYHSVIGKMIFLRNSGKVVKYRKLFNEKHSAYDYEVIIRNPRVERMFP